MKSDSARRVLLIEDDRLVAEGTRAELERAHLRVTISHSCAEALAALEQGVELDFALVDYGLPDQSGTAIGKTLLERFRLPFALLTGHSDQEVVRDAAASGAVGFLLKPASAPEVLAVIETGIARASELFALTEHARRLGEGKRALNTASGIVMERFGLTEEDSARVVRYFARSNRISLEEASQQIVDRRGSLELLSAMSRMLARSC